MEGLRVDVRLDFPGFSLEVDHVFPRQGVTALFGASGSGKTSLLRTIAGLERTASGRVLFEDETWQAKADFRAPHLRDVGYVFQEPRLFPHLTVAGNLNFAERRSRSPESLFGLDEVVRALDLQGLLHRSPVSLSGGEARRVSMGRALLSRPRLLLMDEPLTGLDAERRNEILPFVELLAGRFSVPIIYVSHAIEEVARLAEHMLVLSEGRVVAHGAVQEVLERIDLGPVTGRFEAGAVLSATVLGHDETFQLTHIETSGQSLSIPRAQVAPGSELRLRVRARDVSLAVKYPEGLSIRNVLKGTVADISEEPETAFAEVAVKLPMGTLRARITRASVHDLSLCPGTAVYALIKSIAFDRRSISISGVERRDQDKAANCIRGRTRE